MNKYYSLVTKTGIAAIANAILLGEKVDITDFAVGDGGGSYYQPTDDMTELRNKTWEGKVTAVELAETSPNLLRISAVLPSSIGGFTIREMGALSTDGRLIAISNTPDMEKVVIGDGVSSELQAVIEIAVSNAEVVSFTVDPTVIIATKKDIENHNASPTAHKELFTEKVGNAEFTSHLANAAPGILHTTEEQQAAWSGKADTATYPVALTTAAWTAATAPYAWQQVVAITGMLETDNPIADLVLQGTTAALVEAEQEAFAALTRITTEDGGITAYCLSEKPATAIALQLKVVR